MGVPPLGRAGVVVVGVVDNAVLRVIPVVLAGITLSAPLLAEVIGDRRGVVTAVVSKAF